MKSLMLLNLVHEQDFDGNRIDEQDFELEFKHELIDFFKLSNFAKKEK